MNQFPAISVIIPVFNGEKYIGEAIESVINQTYESAEIIVVNDGSTDSTQEVAKQFLPKIDYYFQTNQGPASALNLGIQKSSSPLLAFLNADDLFTKNKHSIQIEALSADPNLDMVFGRLEHFASPDVAKVVEKRYKVPQDSMPGYSQGPILVKKKAFDRVGLFNTRWKLGEFIDWYLRAKHIGLRSEMLTEIVYLRRVHTSNWTVVAREHQKDYVRIVKASLDRQRDAKAPK